MTSARTKFLIGGALVLGTAGYLMATSIRETGTYYLTPTELATKLDADPSFRNTGVKIGARVVPGSIERIPGARTAVQEHEEWGVFTHYVLGGLAAIELLGLAMRRSPHLRKIHLAAALVGVGAVYSVYETGQHGGALV